jgi:Icc-related predicted phosphoesterase
MTLLHCTDLHFNQQWYEWIANQQEYYDAFCITGDFLDATQTTSLDAQIEWVSLWMKSIQKPLFVCSGNHDYDDKESLEWLNKIPKIYSDGSIKTIDNVKFGCMPYLEIDFDRYEACDVLLTHVPPAKTKTSIHRTKKTDWGDRDLARVLTHGLLSPKVLLCGHMHEPVATQDKIHNSIIHNPGFWGTPMTPKYSSINL